MNKYKKICPVCGVVFSPEHWNTIYCGKDCYKLNNRRKTLMRYSPKFRRQNWPEIEEVIEPEKASFESHTPVEITKEPVEVTKDQIDSRKQPKSKVRVFPRCVRCGFDEAVVLHDIVPRCEGGNPKDDDNLLPLCPNCHFLLHKNRWKLWELELDREIFDVQYWLIEIQKHETYQYPYSNSWFPSSHTPCSFV